MKPTTLFAFLLCAGLFCFQSTNAATFYWTGATSTNWNTAANWAMSSCGGTTATSTPGSSDSAVFSGSCSNNNCTINVSINVLSLRTDNTYTGTLTQGSGNTVTIAYCKFADGTFSGSSAAITISTLLTIEGGSFTTTSGTTTIEGNFSYTGGTFYPNNGRVVFYKTLTVSGVNSSSNINLYDVEFQAIAGNSTITLSNIYFNVADSTLLTGSNQLFINASQSTSVINASGNVKVYNTATTGGGDGFIVMNGSSNQYLVNTSSTDDEGKLPNLSIDNTSGTVYLIGDITMGGSTTLTYTAGTINSGTSTVVFYYDNTITGSMVFNNIEFQGTSSTCIVSNTITVNGNMSNTQTGYEVINTGTIDLYGSLHVSNTSSSDGGSALINFSGSANDSLVFTSGVSSNEGYLPNVTIAKTGGTFCLSGTISINNNWTNNYSTANINYGTATMYFNRSNLSIGGTYCTPVWNAQFASSSEWIYTLTNDSALIVKNNLTLSGSDNFYIDGYSINIYGNIIASNTGGGDLNGTTIFNLVDSQNDSIISPSGYTINECDLPSITINKTGGTLYLIGVISEYGSWTNNYSQSSINPGTSAFFYNCNGGSIGGTYRTPVWNAEFGGSGEYTYNISADSALIVTNNLTIRGSQSFSINGYSLAIHGNIISSNTGGGDGGTTIFNLVGSSTDSIISPSGYTLGECTLAPININKTGGTLYLVGNITEDGNWTYNSGTVNAGTSSVEMIGAHNLTASQMSSYMSFNNLQIGGSGADITLASTLNVGGRLTINGTLNTSSSNYQILVGNSWINNGTYTGNNSNVTFNGSVNDSIKGSDNTTFYSLTANKTGTLTLSDPITVTNALTLTSGDILSSSTNLLTLNNGSSVSGANDNSFVNGPVKKVGNSAFTFPTGAGSSYHAIGISAPSSTSDAFTAQYYNTEQTLGSATDDSLTYVSDCDYWNLTHTTGSSNVTVSLWWGTSSCDIKRLSSLRVGYWNGSQWTDMGQSANTGTTTSGSITATTASTAYGYFAISKHSPTIAVSAGTATTICYGSSTGIGGSPTATGGFSPYTYSWSPATALSSSTASNPTASPITTTTYTVTVNDNDNAPTATATVMVTVNPQIIVNSGSAKKFYICSNDTLGGSPTSSGGTSPYTYNWSSTPTGFSSAVSNPVVSPTRTTTYSLTVTDNVDCTASSNVVITVDTAIQLNVPDTSIQSYSLSSTSDTATWFKFTTDSVKVSFWISLLGGAHFSNLYLYSDSSCHFNLVSKCIIDSAAIDTVRTPIGIILKDTSLTIGQTYYVKLTQPIGNTSSGTLYYDIPEDEGTSWAYEIVECSITPPVCQYICNPYMQNADLIEGYPYPWGLAWGDGTGSSGGPNYDEFGTYSGSDACPPVTSGSGEIAVTAKYTGDEQYGYYTDVSSSGFETEINLTNDPSGTQVYILSYWYNNNTYYQADSIIADLTQNQSDENGFFPLGGNETNCVPSTKDREMISWVPPAGTGNWYHVVACFIAPSSPSSTYEPYNYLIFYPAADPSYEPNPTSVKISNVEIMEVPPTATQTVTILCPATTTTLAPCYIDCTTFSWSGPGGFSSTEPSVTVSTPGTYTCTMNILHNQYNDFAAGYGSCLPIVVTYDVISDAPTITASPSTTVCPGTDVTLTASTGSPFTWSPSTGLSATTGSSVTANPTVTTTYTVTNEDGCTATTVVSVYTQYTPAVNGTSFDACPGSGTYTVTNVESGVTYNWSLNGTPVTTGTSATLTFSSTTTDQTIVVYGYDANDCPFSYTFTVYACCGTNDVSDLEVADMNISDLPDYAAANGFGDYVTLIDGGTVVQIDLPFDYIIWFNGTITIDKNTEIVNPDNYEALYYFGPFASLYINPGKNLSIMGQNALTDGCGTMWQGIYIDGSTASLNLSTDGYDGPVIANAVKAVESNDGGVYTISAASFAKDYIGIQVDPYNYENTSTVIKSFFYCTPGDLITPYAGLTTRSGIVIDNVNGISIGDLTSVDDYNQFQYLNNGINVYNSPGPGPFESFANPIDINYNSFQNILNYDNNNAVDGNGIYISSPPAASRFGIPGSCNVLQTGMNNDGVPYDFTDCLTGIFMTGTGLVQSEYNQMNTVTNGIVAQTFYTANSVFSNNTINHCYTGVGIYQSSDSKFSVYENNITLQNYTGSGSSPFQYIGINVDDYSKTPSQSSIFCNTINCNKVGTGILLYGTGGKTSAVTNTISLVNGGSYFINSTGILLSKATNTVLDNNSITGYSATDRSETGIFCTNSATCPLILNTTNETYYGIKFTLDCAGSQLWNNNINDHTYGFYALKAQMGNQGTNALGGHASGNQWIGPFASSYGVCTDPTSDFFTIYYNASDPYPNSPVCTTSTGGFANTANTDNVYDRPICLTYDFSKMVAVADTLTTIDSTTATDIVNDSAFEVGDYAVPAGDVWNVKRTLYNYILRDTSVLDSLSILRTFYDTAKASAIGIYTAIGDSMQSLMDSVSLTLGDSVRTIMINNILSTNNAAPSTQLYQWAEQQLNAIYIKSIASGIDTFDAGQQDTLQYIAGLCPDLAGAAVFDARSLVMLFDDSVVYNDSTICAGGDEIYADKMKVKPNIIQPLQTYLNVYPNPAKDEVTIAYQIIGNSGVFDLYNITGQLVKSFEINAQSGQTTMSVADIPSGIYIYKLTFGDDSNKLGKLAVIK